MRMHSELQTEHEAESKAEAVVSKRAIEQPSNFSSYLPSITLLAKASELNPANTTLSRTQENQTRMFANLLLKSLLILFLNLMKNVM